MRYLNKKVVIVGGSGFIGTQLALKLQSQGAQVVILDPIVGPLKNVTYLKTDLKTVPDFENIQKPFAVFNLAGVPIFGRWNTEYKSKVRTSRIRTTQNLVEKFKNELYKPEFFVSTSAIGVYGDRGEERLDENSETLQNTYLAQVAYDWEQEALKARDIGIQTRIIRNAHVLGKGGILGVLLKFFKKGLGGKLGNGKQYMSFVSIERCIDAYVDAPFQNNEIKNAVSIEPVTNAAFSKTLAKLIHRPCIFRIPVFAMYILYGEFSKEIVTSQKVYSLYSTDLEDLNTIVKHNI